MSYVFEHFFFIKFAFLTVHLNIVFFTVYGSFTFEFMNLNTIYGTMQYDTACTVDMVNIDR